MELSMSLTIATLAAISQPALWSGAGAVVVLLINKFIPSIVEKKSNKREDFTSITDALFKEIAHLKDEMNRYKVDSEKCTKHYKELQDKFVDFKKTYNELELRYNIQLSINKKLAEEIRTLESQISLHLEQDTLITIVDDK